MADDIFHDDDVERLLLRRQWSAPNGLEIVLPRSFGFCGGVLHAVRLLQQALAEHPGRRIWLLGEIIHNDTVNRYFQEQGATMLPEPSLATIQRLAIPGDLFVIPAFGIPVAMEEWLRHFANPGHVIDTTCAYVRRIWTFVEAGSSAGATVVIHGKPHHPETVAAVSRALATPGHAGVFVVPNLQAARELAAALEAGTGEWPAAAHPQQIPDTPIRQIAFANQTTMLFRETQEVGRVVAAGAASRQIPFVATDTVCKATQDRQDAALELCASRCDLFLVIGGFASSNTTQLYRLAAEQGPAYFIEGASAICSTTLSHWDPVAGKRCETAAWLPLGPCKIGLLAGASCPHKDIGDVIRTLAHLER